MADAARTRPCASGGFGGLGNFPRYWLGVFAQFAYVGAQVGVWSFLIRYTQFNFPGTLGEGRGRLPDLTFALFFAGRFVGTLLMSRFRPATLLVAFAGARRGVVSWPRRHSGGDRRAVRAHGARASSCRSSSRRSSR